jgi:hypothetical protein
MKVLQVARVFHSQELTEVYSSLWGIILNAIIYNYIYTNEFIYKLKMIFILIHVYGLYKDYIRGHEGIFTALKIYSLLM